MNPFLRTLKVSDLLDIDSTRISKVKDLKVEFIEIINVVKPESLLDKIKKLFRRKTALMFYRIFRYKVYSDSGSIYNIFIKTSPSFDKSKFLSNKIQVFCTCSDFKFRVAYWLNQRDNLFLTEDIEKHLNIALTTRPTKITPSNLCKHIYAVLLDFRSRTTNLWMK